MKLTFLGGADEVGASCTFVEVQGIKLLIDAGIRISPKSNRGIDNSQLPDLHPVGQMGGPDFILVTHAHTDHTGALPMIVEQYPHVPVLMTRPTFALTRVLQQDAQRIMKSKKDEEGELPLFDEVSVERLMQAVQLVDFNQPVRLGEGLQVTYHVSGHIAGAAVLVIESTEGNLVMSGDISKSPQRTVKSIEVPNVRADALVMESTYGGKMHAERRAEELRLIEMLKQVTERGGKVLIPAFALGRAQEVIQIILAYRDQFEAPVFVDGMVRSVCDEYVRFRELLPQKMVKSAGEQHLFFRNNIQPVRSTQQRSQIATMPGPAVVVASSGMLTGGASMAYAKYFAPVEENAILLTGYQDEEAPGRFLQRLMREKNEGSDTPTLKLDKEVVKVRCEINTYSLSAHADELEIVNIAQALKPKEVMLVHGDHGARHSIATALRRRQVSVRTPRIGTTYEFSFKKKPWAVGRQLESGSNTGELDLKKLWESLKDRAGDFFSARELAQVWWGSADRENDVVNALNSSNNVYFAGDWRGRKNFFVRTEEQVARTQRQRAIMLAHPDIVGKLIVMRNSNNQPRLAVVKNAHIESFEADVQSSKGSKFPADALVWVIGPWEGYHVGNGRKTQMAALAKDARALADNIFPFDVRKSLVDAGMSVNPDELVPDQLPDGTSPLLAKTAIVLALVQDGAIVDENGLIKPQRALEHGPMDQNSARDLALNFFPKEARLRKVGMEQARKRLLLYFDFPDVASAQFSEPIDELSDTTGWEVMVKPQVNQQALSTLVGELLPEDATVTKGPSIFMDKNEVSIEVMDAEGESLQAMERAFYEASGYRLRISRPQPAPVPQVQAEAQAADSAEAGAASAAPTLPPNGQLEINAAYAHIKQTLMPHGLSKTGLKQGQIVLTFISPQVGRRHQETIDRLSQETGYRLMVHPHPNQQLILQTAQQLLGVAGWTVTKGPGIHTDLGEVSVRLDPYPGDEAFAQVSAQLEEKTGYKLSLK